MLLRCLNNVSRGKPAIGSIFCFFFGGAQFIHDGINSKHNSKKAISFACPLGKGILTLNQKTRDFALLFVSSVFWEWVS